MGDWYKYEPPDPNHPCLNCQMGSCDVTTEMRDGELWTKIDNCHETCELIEQYHKKKDAILAMKR